jgi:uncharacterized protein YjbI with pentapeptide repeats
MPSDEYRAPPEVYRRLEQATPEERVDIVLQLIERHPEGRLELPERNDVCANLHKVDLSREELTRRRSQLKTESPAWWHPTHSGAALDGADLRGANLTDANLQGARLWAANLENAQLTAANLQQGDLWRANLKGAALGNANLQGVVLNRANLQNCFLWHANLQRAVLQGADLRGAELEGTNLAKADLRTADLQEVTLLNCNLEHIYISGARLARTRLRRQQLGERIGEEVGGDCEAARQGYLVLKRNFNELGDYGAASWAHGRERRMEKACDLRQARAALVEGKWRVVIARTVHFASYQLVEWLSDYGESISRVVVSLLVLVGFFMLIYAVTGGVLVALQVPGGTIRQPTRNPIHLFLFSLGTITRFSPVDLEPRNDLIGLVAGLEAFVGLALTGLLGFVVGHRIRRG